MVRRTRTGSQQASTSDPAEGTQTLQHEIQDITGDEEVPERQLERVRSHSEDQEEYLDARIEALQRRDRIRAKRRKLEELERADSAALPPREVPANSLDEPIVPPAIPQIAITPYKGGSYRELKTYLAELAVAFELRPVPDLAKVTLGINGLVGETKQRWFRYLDREHDGKLSNVTWNQFTTWLLEGTSDVSTRCLEATGKLQRCQQGQNQSFAKFLEYYEAIEGEVAETLPTLFRICQFIHKLNEPTKTRLLSCGIPSTWEELRSQGARADIGIRAEQWKGEPSSRHYSPPQRPDPPTLATPQRSANADVATSPVTPTPRAPVTPRQRVTCWKCGGAHYQNTCVEPNCSQCGSRNHTTEKHDNPVPRIDSRSGANTTPVGRRA